MNQTQARESSAGAAPEALLLIAPDCPHCPVVLEGLGTLVKEAVIGRLEVINIVAEPERAQALGVRSVPWARIGPFELEGLQSEQALRRWAEQAGSESGMAAYFDGLLKTGKRQKVEDMVRRQPEWLPALAALLEDPQTAINSRVGVMATFEELEGTGLTRTIVPLLGAQTQSPEARIRADACHALSLTEGGDALPYLRACLQDEDPDVRESAQDAIESVDATRT